MEAAAAGPVLDSGSGLFLVDRSMGELLLGASLSVSVGWSEVCCFGADVLPTASMLLDDRLDIGSSEATAGLLEAFSSWFNWAP